MKTIRVILLASIAALSAMTASEPVAADSNDGLTFNGVISIGDTFLVSLSTQADVKRTSWKQVGQTIGLYRIVSYDHDTYSLELLNLISEEQFSLQLAKPDDSAWSIVADEADGGENAEASDGYRIITESELRTHLRNAREKVTYTVTPRKGTQREVLISGTASGAPRTSDDANENEVDEGQEEAETPAPATPQPEFTEEEEIALAVFEKHHVPVREPPPDVDIIYQVSPR